MQAFFSLVSRKALAEILSHSLYYHCVIVCFEVREMCKVQVF